MGPVDGVLTFIFGSLFINGLKEDSRKEVEVMKPNGLKEMMKMTQLIEDKNEANPISTSPMGNAGSTGSVGSRNRLDRQSG